MTRRVQLGIIILALMATTASADTKTGTANAHTLQMWSFLVTGSGETTITLSWTNRARHVIGVLVCTLNGEPFTFGITAGGLDRYGQIVAGVPSGTSCLMGVTTTRGATPYRIHTTQATSEVTSSRGRQPTAVGAAWYAQQLADRLRLAF